VLSGWWFTRQALGKFDAVLRGGRVPAARFVGLASSMVGDMLLETKVDGILRHADAGEIHVDFMS
jgi:hypothetical protein